ncbi:MAG TPA: protein kinase [Polyangiales bacterium]|nr:protein kinase [Polyangiales bacterium]
MSPRAISVLPPDEQVGASAPAAARYECHKLLGRGGMAAVYEATDRTTLRRVALKQLQTLPDPAKQQRNLELFEREYHMLAQLVHPRIVRVFDFGIDSNGAYYAMELLEGGDLQVRAPLPWREACSIARDVCSALALLHSRRFVHRDVSPRNVRCLADGVAKLIDFGAMSRMGATKVLVGTPPCCAPESVSFQSVDGRTDLFGLGATLYYVLVGQHAYPAHSFSALPEYWRAGFSRPSELVPDIPAELDALVLELLRVDPDARPASPAEVMERLSAIDGCAVAEELRVANAYLSTPVLVGRDAALERIQRRLKRATAGRSRSMLIQGNSGVGRTRFLDACSLEATLLGQAVVRADSDDADGGEYGVVRTLARQLLTQLPELARETATLDRDCLVALIPELTGAVAGVLTPLPFERGRVQRALHAWWTALSKRRPFVVAIDDFHRIDEPSASFIALLEQDTDHELCVLLTVEQHATWTGEAARKLLAPLSLLQLDPLNAEDSEKLLQSVFHGAPNLPRLAHRLQDLCAGSPRDLLRVAQHLVDRGVVRYVGGTWALPAEIDAADLPQSMADALQLQVASLPAQARQLAQILALCPNERFAADEFGQLAGNTDPVQRLAAVEALITVGIAKRTEDDAIKLTQPSWVTALRASMTRTRIISLERQLAELMARRPYGEFRAVQHWFRADDPERALDVLVAHAEKSQEITARGAEIFMQYMLGLPEGWFATFQEALQQCDELKRPPRHRYMLLSRLIGMMGLLNEYDGALLTAVFVPLKRASGYDDWHELDPQLDPKERLLTALARAKSRYDALPESERVMDVSTAIRDLSRSVVAATGGASYALDIPALRSLPRLSIFAGLSPALDVSNKLIEGVDARYSGRLPRARRIYAELLERVNRPDRAGLDASHAEYVKLGVSNALGLIEAGFGMDSCLYWADSIATHLAYDVNAKLIRMVHRLYEGDLNGADECKRTADRLRIQNSARQLYEGGHLITELLGHALSGDLTRVRHAREDIAPFAKRFTPWQPVLRYATAEYHRMARDYPRACAELEQVLASVQVGMHLIWPHAAAAHLLVLVELGEYDRALGLAQTYVLAAERDLEYVPDHLQLSAAVARAYANEPDAGDSVDAQIARLQADGIGGLLLGVAHETRARIALRLQDMPTFGRHAELCGQYFLAHKNSALTAKYHRLVNEGRRRIGAGPERGAATPESAAQYGATRVELALAGCQDGDQRARLALTFLTRQSGSVAGALFMLKDGVLVCVATIGQVLDPESFLPRVNDYLERALEADDITASESEVPESRQWLDETGCRWNALLIAHHVGRQLSITGVAVVGMIEEAPFIPPVETAAAISHLYAERGATSLVLAAD